MKRAKYPSIVMLITFVVLTGCTQPIRLGEKPDQPPVAAILVECATCQSERSGVAPLSLVFDASSSIDDHGIALVHWDLGDGREATGTRIEKSFEVPGKYTITLTVYDRKGQMASAHTEITVLEPPPPEFRVERAENSLFVIERILPNRTLQVGESIQIKLRATAKCTVEYVYWREILPYALSSPEKLEFMVLQLHKDQSYEWAYTVKIEQGGPSKIEGQGRAAWLADSAELTLSTILEVP